MESTSIFQKIENQFEQQLPFVLFALPNSNDASVYLQSKIITNDMLAPHFIFAPFNNKESSNKIFFNECDSFNLFFKTSTSNSFESIPKEEIISKNKHIELVKNAISEIKQKQLKKVIASRKASFSMNNFNLSSYIEQIMSSNIDAFRYVWFHPKTGMWCGATPEILLQANSGCIETMALAGTRLNTKEEPINWESKEREEHQFVIDSIVKRLQGILSVIQVSKTYTHKAGPVAHLRTDIKGAKRSGKITVVEVANKLHPTSAVCGTPRKKAKEFILDNEDYNREFYTGFLGPIWDEKDDAKLFVNLRCVKIEKKLAHIFVGGGITKDSNPEAEWYETQNKMKTMLQVLTPFF